MSEDWHCYLTSGLTIKTLTSKKIKYLLKYRQIDEWNKIERPEIVPQKYYQLVVDNEAKSIQWIKDSSFNK